jgi:hypothetical protein
MITNYVKCKYASSGWSHIFRANTIYHLTDRNKNDKFFYLNDRSYSLEGETLSFEYVSKEEYENPVILRNYYFY